MPALSKRKKNASAPSFSPKRDAVPVKKASRDQHRTSCNDGFEATDHNGKRKSKTIGKKGKEQRRKSDIGSVNIEEATEGVALVDRAGQATHRDIAWVLLCRCSPC